ncbi:hypothetical protein D3C76_1304170 [compost metagenome]
MILGFLAIEAPRNVDLMMLCQRHGGGRRQRDALVGRAEQHIERNAAIDHCSRIESAELGEGEAAVEQAGVEEIRAGTPGLESELTETQYSALDGKANEIALVRLHEKPRTARI